MAKQIRLTLEAAKELLFKHYGLTTLGIREVHGSQSQNFIVSAKLKEEPSQYVFKVTKNLEEDRKIFQHLSTILTKLHITDFSIPRPIMTKYNDYVHIIGYGYDNEIESFFIQLLSFVQGKVFSEVKSNQAQSNALAYQSGIAFAKLDQELMKLNYEESLKRTDYRWNIGNTNFCSSFLYLVEDPELRRTFCNINEAFNQQVLDHLHRLRKCLIHGDGNEDNIIIRKTTKQTDKTIYEVCGIIDFSDVMDSYIVFEVATLMAYMMNLAWHNRNDPVEVASYALKGFQSILPLHEEEKNVLYISILKRFAISACSGWLEKSLGAPKATLRDLHSMGSLAQAMWNKGVQDFEHEIFDKIYE